MKKYTKILMVDNFDSFTYNLVDYFKVQGCEVKVYRNNVEPEDIEKEDFDLLVLSPGPSVPKNAGNLMKIIGHFYKKKPILGVCLGHQALIEFFGGSIKHIPPRHGKADVIINDQQSVYTGVEEKIEVARYHSLAADVVPGDFEISARAEDGTVMSVRHKKFPIEGIQYHPESVLSMKNEVGMKIIQNVVEGKLSAGNTAYSKLAKKLMGDDALNSDDLDLFMQNIAEGQFSEDQKLVILVALSMKLKDPVQLHEFIKVICKYSNFKEIDDLGKDGIDICGTGGSGLPRINTSTLTGLLVSHLGLPIVKHGNKAASGRFGGFNLLEALEVPFRFSEDTARKAVNDLHLAYIFAPDIYPVFKHFAAPRQKVGVPTIFNVLGPLVNPCKPVRQFMGTAFPEYMDIILETAILMKKKHMVVVSAEDKLDEISVSVPTKVVSYKDGEKSKYTIRPEDFGIKPVPFEKVKAESPEQNIEIARNILKGNLDTDHYKLVAVNAAFIDHEFIEPTSLPQAYEKMVDIIKAGKLGEQLEKYKEIVSDKKVEVI